MKYSNLTFTELVNKIGSSRYFDLPKMLKEVLTRLTPQAPKYKVYTALLSQSGTNAPVATVLDNTLGVDIVWSRDNEGEFYGTTTGNLLLSNKTFTTITNKELSTLQFISIQSENQIYIEQVDSETLAYTDFMSRIPVEIRVYS